MLWKNVQQLKASDFRRRVGVKPVTFRAMVREVNRHIRKTRKIPDRCRPCTYGTEDQILMTLMYWREYRTQFHIATDYGLSESAVSRTVKKPEDILSKSKKLELSQKKKRPGAKWSYEVILVDSTETPIERPKKNNKRIARSRVLVEHVIRRIKIFKIVTERYRNRRNRYDLRMKLFAGLYNFERK